jgi:hypothetical protein
MPNQSSAPRIDLNELTDWLSGYGLYLEISRVSRPRKLLSVIENIFKKRKAKSYFGYCLLAGKEQIGEATIQKGDYWNGSSYEQLNLTLIHGIQDYAPIGSQIVVVNISQTDGTYTIGRRDYDTSHYKVQEMHPEIPLEKIVSNSSPDMIVPM